MAFKCILENYWLVTLILSVIMSQSKKESNRWRFIITEITIERMNHRQTRGSANQKLASFYKNVKCESEILSCKIYFAEVRSLWDVLLFKLYILAELVTIY